MTVLVCSNATGTHKLKLLLIGKYGNPRCLKHLYRSSLPVIYRHQSKMWMTQEIFHEWFNNHFVPEVMQHQRNLDLSGNALLLLDNCSAHPKNLLANNGNICCEFLPNVTSVLQPLDCGVIESMKGMYRRHFLLDIIQIQENFQKQGKNISVSNLLADITLKDAMNYISTTWDSIRQDTIRKSFERTLSPEEKKKKKRQIKFPRSFI